MIKGTRQVLFWALLALPAVVQAVPDPNAAWQRTLQNLKIMITEYTGVGGAVTVPDYLRGVDGPPSIIGDSVFLNRSDITSVTIPSYVTNIGNSVFNGCANLTAVCFRGNAPGLGSSVFDGVHNATVYYFEGSLGWGTTFGGCPTEMRLPYTYTTNNGTITITGYIGPAMEYWPV